jgi:hypothetical protein
LVVDDSLIFFFNYLSGRFCVCDDPAAYFRFRSLYLYCVFSFPNFVFLWLHSFHPYIDENTWQNTHNTHKTYTYANEKQKKGHADCHAYRTLDPRRPVYDELSIHPPPRRNVAVPGEEVNQSGASLYAGKWKPPTYHSSLTLLCLIFCLDLHNLNTFSYTLGWRHTLTKQKESRWQSVWYSFVVLTVFFH